MQNAECRKKPLLTALFLHSAFCILQSAHAATFLVPSDRALVQASKAIVLVTAGESRGRWSPGGWIETATAMRVEESIKGPLRDDESFEIVELGGSVDDISYAVAGSPRYGRSERFLLFLEMNDRGEWTAKNMVVGKFSFAGDTRGRRLLLREGPEICGWDTDGRAHREPQRLADGFLAFVRAVARGEDASEDYVVKDPEMFPQRTAAPGATPSIGSYLLQATDGKGIRWPSFPTPVVFLSHGTQPGALNGGLTSLQRGLSVWTDDPSSNVVLQYGGTTTTSNGLARGGADGINSVQFNDPSDEIPGAYTPTTGATLAVGGAWYGTTLHSFGGEQFHTISEADLVVQNGIFGPGLTGNGFDHVIAHELGHTLGFRHSDEPPPGGTSTSNALMASTIDFNADPLGAVLQAWDHEALTAVYGSGATACTPPLITSQPKSIDLPPNSDVVLSVSATGTAPLLYQWYLGTRSNTTIPLQGATTPQISVKPTSTTSYWVRVSNGCNPPADSETAVVTVNGCPAVTITQQSPSTTILEGRSTTLSVTASGGGGLSFQWYVGELGDVSAPIAQGTSASIEVRPSRTTRYWARVTNSCGAFASSETITIIVTPCLAPRVVVQPTGGDAASGDAVTLSATILGSEPLDLQWYEGVWPDASRPVPNAKAATVTIGPIVVPTSFWLAARNDCGMASTAAAVIAIVPSCVAPAITRQPRDYFVVPGADAILEVAATGTSLLYRWYEGAVFDFTKPVGGSAASLYVSSVSTTRQFWVRVTNNCGSANSVAATVTPTSPRRRSASH